MENVNLESKSYFDVFKLLLSDPRTSFKIAIEKSESTPKIILLGLYGLLNVISPILIFEPLKGEILFKLVFKGLAGAAVGWGGIWFLSQLINLLNNLLGGESEFDDVFTIFAFSLTPVIISLLLLTIIGSIITPGQFFSLFYGLLIILAFIYTIVLLFIGNKIVSKNTAFKNLISVSIPVIVMVLLNLLLTGLNK